MTCSRSLMSMALAVSIVPIASGYALAQNNNPPDIRMLLNLDLFAPQQQSEVHDGTGGDSMLQQIQALRAMEYLNNGGTDGAGPIGPPASSDEPGKQPSADRGSKAVE